MAYRPGVTPAIRNVPSGWMAAVTRSAGDLTPGGDVGVKRTEPPACVCLPGLSPAVGSNCTRPLTVEELCNGMMTFETFAEPTDTSACPHAAGPLSSSATAFAGAERTQSSY